ncbi:hemerythrin domain-containing protein [Micromonospora zamorensis]|uniref:hemerythrin domain-containing protein n=1 Tax=Micromonospora zamorensis TaxID=709883 RepID=UPI003CF39F69
MSEATHTLDMTMMFAVHDALRRDLAQLARVSATADDDPRQILHAAVGWEMFKSFLRVHHTSEDVAVWGPMETRLVDQPDRALLDAMEAEHAAIDPLLEAVDAAIADRESGPQRLGDVVDALYLSVAGHLRHEEDEGLRLVESVLTPGQWAAFGQDHRNRVGAESARYLPWLLQGASPETVAAILGRMPEEIKRAYATEWRAEYLDVRPWNPRIR